VKRRVPEENTKSKTANRRENQGGEENDGKEKKDLKTTEERIERGEVSPQSKSGYPVDVKKGTSAARTTSRILSYKGRNLGVTPLSSKSSLGSHRNKT